MIASSCDFFYVPIASLVIGAFAGLLCSAAMNFLPNLFQKIKYYDTRGILYMHAIPGLWSGVISAISAGIMNGNYYGTN